MRRRRARYLCCLRIVGWILYFSNLKVERKIFYCKVTYENAMEILLDFSFILDVLTADVSRLMQTTLAEKVHSMVAIHASNDVENTLNDQFV